MFVDGGPAVIERELSLARRAAARASSRACCRCSSVIHGRAAQASVIMVWILRVFCADAQQKTQVRKTASDADSDNASPARVVAPRKFLQRKPSSLSVPDTAIDPDSAPDSSRSAITDTKPRFRRNPVAGAAAAASGSRPSSSLRKESRGWSYCSV